jgi:Xaa-Pro aminopeptidase
MASPEPSAARSDAVSDGDRQTPPGMAALPAELAEKERRLRTYMVEHGLAAILLTTHANFAWATGGGANFVATNTETGVASLLFTLTEKFLICDDVERERIAAEEVEGQGFQIVSYPWHEPDLAGAVRQLASGRIGADTVVPGTEPLTPEFATLRYALTPAEVARYRELGLQMGLAMTRACHEVRPGLAEHQIAAMLAGDLRAFGIVPTVLLVAADERAYRYRHPIPTGRKLERLAMLVAGGRREGLIATMTRLVHFGALPAELRRKHDAVVRVDTALITATQPGARVAAIFQAGLDAYAQTGFPDEWHLHHQGGATGYAGRDYRATAHTTAIVQPSQAFAWNPTISGTKSEDTLLATDAGPQILTVTRDLPKVDVNWEGGSLERPDILIR